MSADPENGTPPTAQESQVRASRLITTLSGAGAIAGGLIVIVFALTAPAIEAHRAQRLDQAVTEVLRGPARYDTLYLVDGAISEELPSGADPKAFERVYLGHTADGSPLGFAVVAQAPGFSDMVQVIFGYDPATRTLLGMKVLENRETPGLGDRIEKDADFVGQFAGLVPPLESVKAGAGKGGPSEVDLITGATISSRTVVRIINDALARLGPELDAAGVKSP
jgi:electron transport complex protein RnfG